MLLAAMATNQYVSMISLVSKPLRSNFGKDAVKNFNDSMIEEIKYCSNVMKKILQQTCND